MGSGPLVAVVTAALCLAVLPACQAPGTTADTRPAAGPRMGPFEGRLLDMEILGRLLWLDADRGIGVMEFTHPRFDPAPGLRLHSYDPENLARTGTWEISAHQQSAAIGLRLVSGNPAVGDVLAP
ncbi:MAG: hypothetical protein JJT96_02510 [Opitutales bacterium]|nr:hypothetical protein [Opitutales bacterium]